MTLCNSLGPTEHNASGGAVKQSSEESSLTAVLGLLQPKEGMYPASPTNYTNVVQSAIISLH